MGAQRTPNPLVSTHRCSLMVKLWTPNSEDVGSNPTTYAIMTLYERSQNAL